MSWYSPLRNWLGQKAFAFGAKSMWKVAKDNSHPEKHKARDALQANLDAQAFRTNNDIIAAYSKAVQNGVVATGFNLQYKSPDEKLNEQVEFFLSHWSEYGNCELTGRFFRQELERFVVAEACTIGGLIIRHHWDKKLPTLYNMEIISTTKIDRTKNDFAKGLFFGVQTDRLGKITGIHIYKDDNRQASELVSMKHLILYVDIWTDPHQYTNVTPLAPILNTLDKLAAYSDAELDSVRERSKKSVIIATEAYSVMLSAQEEYAKNVKKEKGETSTEYAQAVEEYQEILSGFSASGLHENATPIMPGDNTKVWDLKSDNSTIYADINLNSKQVMSRAFGLSPSTVTGIPESSYNTALKNAQLDEEQYAIIGQQVVEKILKASYRKAIEAGYILDFYEIEDYYTNKIKYDSYLKITRRKKGHIDPLKQNAGDALATSEGFESSIEVISNRGRDYQDVIKDEVTYELAKKKAFEKEGLTYIQSGTENLKLVEAKEQIKQQDEEETKTEDKDEN